MAAIETLKLRTLTVGTARDTTDRTTPRTTLDELPTTGFSSVLSRRTRRNGTAAVVEPEECGDRELHNEAELATHFQPSKVVDTEEDDGAAARARSEVARDVLRRVEQLAPLIGDVSLPVNVQLLKRELSRCHDVLGDHPNESNFLSIVTLVESAISQLKWKEYDRSQLERIASAIAVGYRQARVTYDDYAHIRSAFAEGMIDANPRIPLELLELKDLTDDEEE